MSALGLGGRAVKSEDVQVVRRKREGARYVPLSIMISGSGVSLVMMREDMCSKGENARADLACSDVDHSSDSSVLDELADLS